MPLHTVTDATWKDRPTPLQHEFEQTLNRFWPWWRTSGGLNFVLLNRAISGNGFKKNQISFQPSFYLLQLPASTIHRKTFDGASVYPPTLQHKKIYTLVTIKNLVIRSSMKNRNQIRVVNGRQKHFVGRSEQFVGTKNGNVCRITVLVQALTFRIKNWTFV